MWPWPVFASPHFAALALTLTLVLRSAGPAEAFRDAVSLEDTDLTAPGDSLGGQATLVKLTVPPGATQAKVRGASQLQGHSQSMGFEEELAAFKNLYWIKNRWAKRMTTQTADATALVALTDVQMREVPGLNGVTFGDVFEAVQKKCPIWIIGGAVRDMLVGGEPKDIDLLAFCNTSKVLAVADEMGWSHTPFDKGGMGYFGIGDSQVEKPRYPNHYLEGFKGNLLFDNPSDEAAPDMTVSILLWALSSNTIIDPTGLGINDAMNKVLRPAVKEMGKTTRDFLMARYLWLFGAPPEKQTTVTWDKWEGASDSDRFFYVLPKLRREMAEWKKKVPLQTSPRHARYLKMRMRGWQPPDECTRAFFANTIAGYSVFELRAKINSNHGTVFKAFGYNWVQAPLATLMMLGDEFEGASKVDQAFAVHRLAKVYEEDMAGYFAGTSDEACQHASWKWVYQQQEEKHYIGSDDGQPYKLVPPKSVKDIIQALVTECEAVESGDKSWYELSFRTMCETLAELLQKM